MIMILSISRIKYVFTLCLIAISLSSCFVSSRCNVDVLNKSEFAGSVSVKTIKLPMFVTKPILKKYLRNEEGAPKEVTELISNLKNVRITLAQTSNPVLINDFRTAIKEFAGEEWFSLYHGNQWIYLKVDQNAKDAIKIITVAFSAPEKNQLGYISMKCNLTPDQLSRLINFVMDSNNGKKFLKEEVKG